jgi:hypothetical protein
MPPEPPPLRFNLSPSRLPSTSRPAATRISHKQQPHGPSFWKGRLFCAPFLLKGMSSVLIIPECTGFGNTTQASGARRPCVPHPSPGPSREVMKSEPANAAADLLTRYLRAAQADLLISFQNREHFGITAARRPTHPKSLFLCTPCLRQAEDLPRG